MPLRLVSVIRALPAALLLASGIGSTTTIAILLDALVWNPLAVEDAGRVLHLGGLAWTAPHVDVAQWWRQAGSVRELTLYRTVSTIGTTPAGQRTVLVSVVDEDFFRVFRHAPELGRLLGRGDRHLLGAVISNRTWSKDYGRAKEVLGLTIQLNNVPYLIVGVAGSEFAFPRPADAWVVSEPRENAWATLPAIRVGTWEGPLTGWAGKLDYGQTVEAARSEFGELLKRLDEIILPRSGVSAGHLTNIVPLTDRLSLESRPAMLALGGAAVVVLLLTSLTAGLFLLKNGLVREREFAVRQALGASRAQVAKLVCLEAVQVVLMSTAVSFLVTFFALTLFERLASTYEVYAPKPPAAGVPVVLATAVVACLTAVVVGAIPTARVLKGDLLAPLQRSAAIGATASSLTRQCLVSGQIALAVLIVAAAATAGQSLLALSHIEVGVANLETEAIRVDFPPGDREQTAARWRSMLMALSSIPSVRAVALANTLPFVHDSSGVWAAQGSARRFVAVRTVSDQFFSVTGISVLRGDPSPPAGEISAVLPASVAQELFGGLDVVGRTFDLEGEPTPRRVLAVVSDLHPFDLGGLAERTVFLPLEFPYREAPLSSAAHAFVQCRTSCDRETRSNIAQVAARFSGVTRWSRSLGAVLDERLSPARTRMAVGLTYAVFAVGIAVAGVLTLAQALAFTRAREAGLRQALGASPVSAVVTIAGEAYRAALVGVSLGLLLTLPAERLLLAFVPGQAGVTFMTNIGAAALLLLVITIACTAPAVSIVKRSPSELINGG